LPVAKPVLHLGNAVAAIVTIEREQYLLQLRDEKPEIWYPGHWGLFGGSVDPGEDEIAALRRELSEEIEFELDARRATLFARFDFDLRPAGLGSYYRSYYEVAMSRQEFNRLVLHEGADMRAFTTNEVLALRLSPYDGFALLLHHERARLGVIASR
jgi:8-oxo-dGTP pyrophosphatase MutT (NUDIX family)